MKFWTTVVVIAALVCTLAFMPGCQQAAEEAESAAEKAADKAEEMVGEAGEMVEEAGEEMMEHMEGEEQMAMKDPVCGMTASKDAPHSHEYEGKTYYFCSESCMQKFVKDPASFLDS